MTKFGRRHYIVVARIVKNANIDVDAKKALASAFVETFANDNPRFDKTRFGVACGIEW